MSTATKTLERGSNKNLREYDVARNRSLIGPLFLVFIGILEVYKLQTPTPYLPEIATPFHRGVRYVRSEDMACT